MLLAFFRLIGKVFFREIVIEGRENLPASGPAILAPNHPPHPIDVRSRRNELYADGWLEESCDNASSRLP